MKKLTFVILFLMVSAVSASTVERSIETMDGVFKVTLSYINEREDSWLLINEIYPEGFTVIDEGEGSVLDDQHMIKWAVIQDPITEDFTYVLHPNSDKPSTGFDGSYLVSSSGNNAPVAISGEQNLDLETQSKDSFNYLFLSLLAIFVIAMIIVLLKYKKSQKAMDNLNKRKTG